MSRLNKERCTDYEERESYVMPAAEDGVKEERMQRRIRREVIRVPDSKHGVVTEDDVVEELDRDDAAAQTISDEGGEGQGDKRHKSLWGYITTGSFLTSSGARQYYRYLVAIAVMCFVSIFLKFMSLNADMESRRLETEATVLRERAILFKEQRHDICTKSEVERLLSDDGIEMTNLSGDSRIIRR